MSDCPTRTRFVILALLFLSVVVTVRLIIGALVGGGDFSLGLTYISGLALIGALAYILMVGQIERLQPCL